jgi:hypothetical protein
VRRHLRIGAAIVALSILAAPPSRAQEAAGPEAISDASLQTAIDRLGSLDYATRTAAAGTVRRTESARAVPALLRAVAAHDDGYVRFKALVLLTGFHDGRTGAAMREALASPNDRLRTVAYGFFEHQPDPARLPDLLAALDREFAEFVRPALVRALAAYDDERVRQALKREAGRGEDFFRSAVIEALGDHKATYAFDTVRAIAAIEGPLQDDAALALGRIGDPRALSDLSALRLATPRARQPAIAAAICLLGVDCDAHERDVIAALTFADATPGHQELLRAAAAGLGALGVAGRTTAVEALLRIGMPSQDPTRAPVALALATVGLRNTPLLLSVLAIHPARMEAIALLAEGFDMLEEDLQKERFFAFVRRRYWESGPGSADGALMRDLIRQLNF